MDVLSSVEETPRGGVRRLRTEQVAQRSQRPWARSSQPGVHEECGPGCGQQLAPAGCRASRWMGRPVHTRWIVLPHAPRPQHLRKLLNDQHILTLSLTALLREHDHGWRGDDTLLRAALGTLALRNSLTNHFRFELTDEPKICPRGRDMRQCNNTAVAHRPHSSSSC
jgi:hypothetical protein